MTTVKLCGLARECEIAEVNVLLPEYIGFVFVKDRRRYIPPERARMLKARLNPKIRAVGVFIDAPPETVAALFNNHIIDLAQLHGQEDDGYIAALRRLTDCPVIRAFRIDSAQDVARASESPADFILLDNGTGGTGAAFDWSLLHGLARPFFLAGGLNPGNVADAIARCRPYGVDVSSGIETDGLKDLAKMRQFVAAVRKAPQAERMHTE